MRGCNTFGSENEEREQVVLSVLCIFFESDEMWNQFAWNLQVFRRFVAASEQLQSKFEPALFAMRTRSLCNLNWRNMSYPSAGWRSEGVFWRVLDIIQYTCNQPKDALLWRSWQILDSVFQIRHPQDQTQTFHRPLARSGGFAAGALVDAVLLGNLRERFVMHFAEFFMRKIHGTKCTYLYIYISRWMYYVFLLYGATLLFTWAWHWDFAAFFVICCGPL